MANGKLPSLSLVRFSHDHMGSFGTALGGVNTPETQQADCDLALGRSSRAVANSRYAARARKQPFGWLGQSGHHRGAIFLTRRFGSVTYSMSESSFRTRNLPWDPNPTGGELFRCESGSGGR